MPMSAQVSRLNSPRDSSLEKEGQAETIRKKINEDLYAIGAGANGGGKKKIVKKIIKKKQGDGQVLSTVIMDKKLAGHTSGAVLPSS